MHTKSSSSRRHRCLLQTARPCKHCTLQCLWARCIFWLLFAYLCFSRSLHSPLSLSLLPFVPHCLFIPHRLFVSVVLGCAYVVFQGGTKSTRNCWDFLEMAANRSYCNWKIPNNVPNSCCIFFCICTAVNLIEEVTLVCCCLLYTNNTHLHLWLLMVRISIWIVGNFHINNQYVVFIRNLNKILSITQTHESICYSSIEYSMHSDWMKCWTIWEVCGFDCVSFNQQLMHANNALRFMNV